MDNSKEEAMIDFIETARVSDTNYCTFEISSKLSDKLVEAIKQILGVDVSEYKNEIFEDIVRHIELHHGKNGISDHSMENMEDLTKIEEITEEFDSISKGKQSTKFKSNGNFADTILLNKTIDDKEYIVAEAVPTSKRKSLEVVTMYSNSFKANSVNEKICNDLKQNGFQPTKALVSHMEKLNKLIGKEVSIKDVHNIYSSLKNPEVQDVVNEIAKECRTQELMKNVSQLIK